MPGASGCEASRSEIPSTPILFCLNQLRHSQHRTTQLRLMKPEHLIHEIDKIFFFWRGLDSHHSGGILSSLKETLPRALRQRFDTTASMVRIASSGDTHRPQRTPNGCSEFRFRTTTNSVLQGWPCPQFLRRRRAQQRDLATQLLSSRGGRRSSEPSAIAIQHSARSAGSRSTIARVTNQCRK